MEKLLGIYKATQDIKATCGTTVFTLPQGFNISVTQVNPESEEVMVDFGPGFSDWKHKSFLNRFKKQEQENAKT
jgi:hypothetical protein